MKGRRLRPANRGGGTDYEYDANNNVVGSTYDSPGRRTESNYDASCRVTDYTYDSPSRLTVYTYDVHDNLVSYAYVVSGRLLPPYSRQDTTYVFGSYIDAVPQFAKLRASGQAFDPICQRTCVFGSYIDEVLCMVKADNSRYFYSTNDLYSTYALTDGTGTVVERYMYDPYGNVTVLAPDGHNRQNSQFVRQPVDVGKAEGWIGDGPDVLPPADVFAGSWAVRQSVPQAMA